MIKGVAEVVQIKDAAVPACAKVEAAKSNKLFRRSLDIKYTSTSRGTRAVRVN
jgi:hypothetical protein